MDNVYNQAEISIKSQIPRTLQKFKWDRYDTLNMGDLGIACAIEVLPNTSMRFKMQMLTRILSALVRPVMTNMYCQVAAFFVPNRLTDEHWEEIMGENKQGPWITNKTEYEVPYIEAPTGGWQKGTVADKLGIRTGVAGLKVNSHYTKGYCQIWNDFYRDENINNFTHITTNTTNLMGTNGDNYVTDPEKGGKLLRVCKKHDLFTSLVRQPQKGPDVLLPLGIEAPVVGNGKTLGLTDGTNNFGISQLNTMGIFGTNNNYGKDIGELSDGGSPTSKTLGVTEDPEKSGMIVDLSLAQPPTVNEWRMAITMQHLYELDTMGTRYNEMIYNHFGVRTSDARLQRAEYLGGKDIPLNMSQVIQTSATETEKTALGDVGGLSLSYDEDVLFSHSFVEHGIVYVLLAFKQEHVYQQGLNAKFSRFKRTDFYDPIFANIGYQPIFQREIYATGVEAEDNKTLGFTEAWANYRFHPSEVCGQFRSEVEDTLDVYHLADDFGAAPTLSDEFIFENPNNLDRCLTIPSTIQDQFGYQIHFDVDLTLPMPVHSLPGLKRL